MDDVEDLRAPRLVESWRNVEKEDFRYSKWSEEMEKWVASMASQPLFDA